MIRAALYGLALAALAAGGALAQGAPPLPQMPKPPSFDEPVAAEKKPGGKKAKGAASANGAKPGYDRPGKYVPAEFDRERSGAGGGATPMMSSSGRPGMGMKF